MLVYIDVATPVPWQSQIELFLGPSTARGPNVPTPDIDTYNVLECNHLSRYKV